MDEAVSAIKRTHKPFGLVGFPGNDAGTVLVLHQCRKDGSAVGGPLAVVGMGAEAAAVAEKCNKAQGFANLLWKPSGDNPTARLAQAVT